MSNLPGDLSADPLSDISANLVADDLPRLGGQHTSKNEDEKVNAKSVYPDDLTSLRLDLGERKGHGSLSSSVSNKDDEEADPYISGKLRDLSGYEGVQFPGLKREKFW